MLIFKDLLSRWWFQCIMLWLAAFVLLNSAGVVGARILDLREGALNNSQMSPYNIPGIWIRWDAGYYLDIATKGYVAHPEAAGFFPLYPMLIGSFYRITSLDPVVIGFLISNVSFLISVLLFYKIARVIKDDHIYAMRSVLAMIIFPTSFYYFALYAESLYLLLTLSGVYLILRNQQSFIGSGLALGLSSIARPVGWLADIVILGEFIRRRKFDVKNIVYLGLTLFLSILGILIYVYYLYIVLGTFTAIPDAQSQWSRQWQFPWVTYWEGIRTLLNPSFIRENWFGYAINAMDLFFTSFAVLIIIISFMWAKRKEFPWSLSAYSTLALLFFLSSQNELPVPLWGMSRWIASLFPLYFILGNMFKNKTLQSLYYIGSVLLLVFLTAWWTSGRWVG